jgi:hypothetical protein
MPQTPPDAKDAQPSTPGAPAALGAQRSRPRRLALWAGGLIVSAIAALAVASLTSLPGQLFDLDAAKDRLRPGDDLAVRVDVLHLDDQGFSMVAPTDAQPTEAELAAIRSFDLERIEQLSASFRRRGWFELEQLTLRLALQGPSNQEVEIVDIRPIELERTPLLSGTLSYLPPQEGAASIALLLNTDELRPVMRAVAGVDEWGQVPGEPYFETTTISLADRERDVVVIRASAQHTAVRFKLRLDYLLGGELKTIVIDDEGRPFRITPLNCVARGVATYQAVYEFGVAEANPASWQINDPQIVEQTAGTDSPLRTQIGSCLRGKLPAAAQASG